MKMNDMMVISVDDHISEPPGMFDRHLSGDDLKTAPKFLTLDDGTSYWEYQGMKMPSVGLNAVVGRPLEEYGMEPTSLEQLRKGCYDPKGRIDDMNVNGIAASLNFGSFPGFDGGRFHKAPDKAQALVHMRAYNDWHIDEWCGSAPGRFIPCALLPTWDIKATVAEIGRIARKGCTAVSINENPTVQGLPSIHNAYWEPLWKAIVEHDIAICLHIGAGNPAPHASMETPIEAWITTMPMSIATGAADWLNLEALLRYPQLRIALSEGGIGWIPYFLERADFSHERHKAWTHSHLTRVKPSELFKRHFLTCFIDDAFGLKNLDALNEDLVSYECDYPHSDSLWPNVPEHLWESVKHLSETQIDKVTHRNAMRFFRFDPLKHHTREQLQVDALRAQAKADGVDVTPRSSGGAKPLADGEQTRPITSGDLMRMFAHHAKADKKPEAA
jgi:predicted TIM-barrel fold metal-dependent hydrolase